jgi:hypothetical protein
MRMMLQSMGAPLPENDPEQPTHMTDMDHGG